jgi:hypothetical protein
MVINVNKIWIMEFLNYIIVWYMMI